MIKTFNIIILLLIQVCCYSQGYQELLTDYNEWQFTTCNFGCKTDKYFTSGDTLINGYYYKVLDGYHFIERNILLREDKNEKKVYLRNTNDAVETDLLLYDFSSQPGDLIAITNSIGPFMGYAGFFMVDSVIRRSLEDNSNARFYYLSSLDPELSGTNQAIWVEGIGSLSLITAPGGEVDINKQGHLSCFFREDELIYSNTDSIEGCSTDFILKTEKQNKIIEANYWTVYPNPASEIIHLTNTEQIKMLRIISYDGTTAKEIRTNFEQMNISGLDHGFYIIEIYDHLDKVSYLKFEKL